MPAAVFRRKSLAKAGMLAFLGAGAGLSAQAQIAVKEHLVSGSEAFMDGDADAALTAFGEATQDEDMGGVALYNQGCAHMQAEDWTSAKASFDKAAQQLQGTGLEEFAHYNASISALVEGDAQEAIERAKQTLRLNPDNDDARHNLALAQRMQQQQQQDQEQEQQDQEQQDQEQQDQEQQDQEQQGQEEQDQQEQGQDQPQDGQNEQEAPQPQDGQEGDEPNEESREGQISRADMERILESLERQEQEVQAKLRQAKAQQGQGKSRTIEKDW